MAWKLQCQANLSTTFVTYFCFVSDHFIKGPKENWPWYYLSNWFDSLPHAKVHTDPTHEKANGKLHTDFSWFINSIRQLEDVTTKRQLQIKKNNIRQNNFYKKNEALALNKNAPCVG